MSDKVDSVLIKEADEKSAKTNSTNYKTVISGNISEFASTSSIHGIKYFAGEDRSLFERYVLFNLLRLYKLMLAEASDL